MQWASGLRKEGWKQGNNILTTFKTAAIHREENSSFGWKFLSQRAEARGGNKFSGFFQDGIVVFSMRQSEVYHCVCVCVCFLTFWALYFVDMPTQYWLGARIKFWRFSNSCSIFYASKSSMPPYVRKFMSEVDGQMLFWIWLCFLSKIIWSLKGMIFIIFFVLMVHDKICKYRFSRLCLTL